MSLDCDVKQEVDCIHQPETTSSVAGPRKKRLQSTSQGHTGTKKTSWPLFIGVLAWSTTAFWIPEKPLHLRSVLSKSMRCTKNCNTCSHHWSTERAQFFSTTMPNQHVAQPTFQKLNKLGYKVLPHPPYSPDLSPIHYHFFKHLDNFSRENASTTSRKQKMLSKRLSNPETWIFTLQE